MNSVCQTTLSTQLTRAVSWIATVIAVAVTLCGVVTENASAQHFNMTQVANVPGGLRSIWGYTQGGREYALACAGNFLRIYEVTTPAAPVLRASIASTADLKEVKTYLNYAYCVNQNAALQVVDLQFLPDSAKVVGTFSSATVPGQHTIWIDGAYAYLGMNGAGIADYRILDLANPIAPVELSGTPHPSDICGAFVDAHDSYVVGNRAYVANLAGGMSILDITNKNAPVVQNWIGWNNTFCHSMRTTTDERYLFTTDETPDGHLRVWDVQDINNVTEVAQHYIPGHIIHNVFLKDPFLFASYYTDGVRVFDVSDPLKPTIVGSFDTYLQSEGNTFNGCWDVYPYFASGTIVTSDLTNGMHVITFNNTEAGTFAGTVTDATSGQPIQGATVTWAEVAGGNSNSDTTDALGQYSLGVPASPVNLTVSRGGYVLSVQAINPTANVTTTFNVALNRTTGGRLTVNFSNRDVAQRVKGYAFPDSAHLTDDNLTGALGFRNIPFGSTNVLAGQWGKKNVDTTIAVPISSDVAVNMTMKNGYEDNFELDLGWIVGGSLDTIAAGIWERGEPVGSVTGGFQVQPETDNGAGNHRFCYFTGNPVPASAAVGACDIDNGRTTLTSPTFDLSATGDPQVSYDRWFSNNRGGNPNLDPWIVELSNNNGTSWTTLENTAVSNAAWTNLSFRVLDFMPLTANMKIRFIASDDCLGSVVEAAIDNFKVTDLDPPSCCIGFVGNVDNDIAQSVDIADLTVLVDHLFITFSPLACEPEADIVADASIDIADLTALVDHLFISFTPLNGCL